MPYWTIILLMMLLLASQCWGSDALILKADFDGDSGTAGWTYSGDDTSAARVSPGRLSPYCLTAREGTWESPKIPVEPFHYYRITFYSRAEDRAYWCAVYFDSKGEELVADHYWGVDKSDRWIKHDFCTRARVNAAHVAYRFQPLGGKRLSFDEVTVRAASRNEVAAWADDAYSLIPPVKYDPPSDRWKYLPRTMDTLRKGGTLRVVMLGDSIMNDTGNSPCDVLIERMYPGARVEIVNSVRGGTGTSYYKAEGRVKEYVTDFAPDLLVIGGISNGDIEATRSVIRQMRTVADAEVLVLTGAVCIGMDPTTNEKWTFAADPKGKGYRNLLVNMAKEEKVQYLDMTGPWGRYISASGMPLSWFQRDETHANLRGALVLAKVLEKYFAPKDSKNVQAETIKMLSSSWRGELGERHD